MAHPMVFFGFFGDLSEWNPSRSPIWFLIWLVVNGCHRFFIFPLIVLGWVVWMINGWETPLIINFWEFLIIPSDELHHFSEGF